MLGGRRFFLAFDAGSVSVAVVVGSLRAARLERFARAALPPGALVPSPSGANLQRAEEVREALRGALASAAAGAAAVTLVLPDGVARLALLTPPADGDASEYVRFRLAPSLPWPAAEAIVDALPAGGRRVVGAAVRRGTVAEYEQLAASAGVDVQRVHLAPLLALAGAMRASKKAGVEIVLGDAAACFAALRDGGIVALSCRRRDSSADEARRLVEQAERTARLTQNGALRHEVQLRGADARRLGAELGLRHASPPHDAGAVSSEAAEAAWLRGVLS